MTTTRATVEWPLRDFLLGPAHAAGPVPGQRTEATVEQTDALAWRMAQGEVVRLDRAVAQLSEGGRKATDSAVARAVEQLCDLDLGELLASGWRTHRKLLAAARSTLAAPGREEVVELATHTVTSEHRPWVDLLVDGAPVARIPLRITVEFTLHAVVAVVRAGRLCEVRAGYGELEATLSAAEVQLAHRRGQFELRAYRRFRHPLPLIAAAV